MTGVFLAIFLAVSTLYSSQNELPFVLVIPSYNNTDWYKNNINSVLGQKYSNYRIIYINDCSSDTTGQDVENELKAQGVDYQVLSFDSSYIEDSNASSFFSTRTASDLSVTTSKNLTLSRIDSVTQRFKNLVNQEKHFFTLVNNKTRSGALANLYRAIYSCYDNEIIATVDGDDWLRHENVIQDLHDMYSSKNIWLTHGRLIEYPNNSTGWSLEIPSYIVENNQFRSFRLPSHLRTFYAWLFKNIKTEDLLYKDDFYPMTWDMAMMYPMIEMAGERHAYGNSISYVYNVDNQLNDNKVNAKLQNDIDAYISKLPPYQRLKDPAIKKTLKTEILFPTEVVNPKPQLNSNINAPFGIPKIKKPPSKKGSNKRS